MDKKVDIKNIYSLKNFVNCEYHRKEILEYFEKKTHTSRTNDFKPNSEKWLKAKEEDEKISSIPDHNVNLNYDRLIIQYSYEKLEFSIGTITVKKTEYCYSTEEYVSGDVTLNFLVENSYWGHGLICSFSELINHDNVQSFFEKTFDDQKRDEWQRHLESTYNGVFMLLLDKILKAEKNLTKVGIFSSLSNSDNAWVEIGEEKYYMKDMLIINEAYKNDDYEFYDENDRKIKYSWYQHESFPDFYLEYSKINQN
jgi:hypothetical protein